MAKKVLYLITKSNFGGAQLYVHDLAVGLSKNGWGVAVAAGGNGLLISKLQEKNIRTISIPSLERDVSIIKEWRALKEISSIIKEERPDVLHINSSKAGALGAIIGRYHKVPKIIFTTHGWAFNEDRPRWQRLILKFIHWVTVLLSHQTIAVSHEVARQMNWVGAERKITVIHNGREIKNLLSKDGARDFLIEHTPALTRFREDFWSLTVAELHKVKRHDAVIKAMKEVARLSPRHRHLIIGGGQEESHLRQLITDYELTENVFMLGAIPEAAQYLKAADIFILTSRSEAMPYAIIEACIAELPIIASDVGGIPEVIKNEQSGLLVPAGKDRTLTKTILRLITDPALQEKLSVGALERSEHFHFSDTLEKTTALYLSSLK